MANEGLAFVLEALALILLAWWGFTTGGALVLHVLPGIGAPVSAAVLWGMFAAVNTALAKADRQAHFHARRQAG
ncbi:DUF2568 domain-containing protein [Spirillospora sp. CA-253888]